MSMSIRAGGVWKELTAGKVRVNGAWRNLVSAQAYIDGAWKVVATFVSTMTVALSQSSVSRSARLGTINTAAVTCTPTGGLNPYTYSWVKQSGDTITANQPTSASCAFQASGMVEEEVRTAVFRCTVTDTLGTAVTSSDLTVTITRLEPLDIGGNL
jgi:hypothetical protein